jgi:hypothetical protein
VFCVILYLNNIALVSDKFYNSVSIYDCIPSYFGWQVNDKLIRKLERRGCYLIAIITGICPTILVKPMINARIVFRQRFETDISTNKNLTALRQPPPARLND